MSASKTKKPRVFKCRADLHAAINVNRQIIDDFFFERSNSIDELVTESVSGNTFRAFPLKRYGIQPSVLYRKWACNWLEQNLSEIRRFKSRSEMGDAIITAAHALNAHWNDRTEMKCELGFGRAAKMLNLTAKYLLRWAGLTDSERTKLKPLLHVPLDSYTLLGIMDIDPSLGISKKSTMKFICSEHQYIKVQDCIFNVCKPSFDPIDYEITAWNSRH
jgi:hypothetical protein